MAADQKPQLYRDVIDELVRGCTSGQGRIGADRARRGEWNANASLTQMPEQHEINVLLGRLDEHEREVLARMLTEQYVAGAFEALRVLEALHAAPFDTGYEGSPYDDFIGRLSGEWDWPANR